VLFRSCVEQFKRLRLDFVEANPEALCLFEGARHRRRFRVGLLLSRLILGPPEQGYPSLRLIKSIETRVSLWCLVSVFSAFDFRSTSAWAEFSNVSINDYRNGATCVRSFVRDHYHNMDLVLNQLCGAKKKKKKKEVENRLPCRHQKDAGTTGGDRCKSKDGGKNKSQP